MRQLAERRRVKAMAARPRIERQRLLDQETQQLLLEENIGDLAHAVKAFVGSTPSSQTFAVAPSATASTTVPSQCPKQCSMLSILDSIAERVLPCKAPSAISKDALLGAKPNVPPPSQSRGPSDGLSVTPVCKPPIEPPLPDDEELFGAQYAAAARHRYRAMRHELQAMEGAPMSSLFGDGGPSPGRSPKLPTPTKCMPRSNIPRQPLKTLSTAQAQALVTANAYTNCTTGGALFQPRSEPPSARPTPRPTIPQNRQTLALFHRLGVAPRHHR